MSKDIHWIQGVLETTERGSTGSGNPKTTLNIRESPDLEHCAHVHFSGRDLAKIPSNIDAWRGHRMNAGFELLELTKYPGSFSKQGRDLVLPDAQGNLPMPPPPIPTPAAPAAAPPPPPPATGGPNNVAYPPPQQQTYIPPADTGTSATPPPPPGGMTFSPPGEFVPTFRDIYIAREACIKSPIVAAILGKNPTPGQARMLIDYFVDYIYDAVPRITGGQHRHLEALIAKDIGSGTRRTQFKEFLLETGWEELGDSGRLHLTDMSREHATKLLDKWWNTAVGAFSLQYGPKPTEELKGSGKTEELAPKEPANPDKCPEPMSPTGLSDNADPFKPK